MIIRRVKQEDGALIRDLTIRMCTDSPDAFGESLEKAKQRTFEDWDSKAKWLAESPDVIGLIAYDHNQPCGFVMGLTGRYLNGSMDFQCRECVTIARNWIAPKARRKGIGTKLTNTIKDWACEKGIRQLELQVTENNEVAKSFYEKLGFKDTGHREPLVSNPKLQIHFLTLKL